MLKNYSHIDYGELLPYIGLDKSVLIVLQSAICDMQQNDTYLTDTLIPTDENMT